MIVFEAAAGRDTEFCFVGRQPRSARMGGGFGAKPPTPVPAGGVSIATSGGGSTLPEEGSQQFSNIVGRVGAGVSGVSVRFADGGHVAARIANGWFLAWWPGRRPLARTDAITVRLRA